MPSSLLPPSVASTGLVSREFEASRGPRADQAQSLRWLLDRRAQLQGRRTQGTLTRCQTLAITSGKGGTGKSVIALNLAIALAERGARVCLIDAATGLGHLDLLCGLNGYWNLTHVVQGARQLDEILLTGPAGLQLLPGASALADLERAPLGWQTKLLDELAHMEATHDVMLVDTGSGSHELARTWAAACKQALVVTTPEPTAIADAYATLKALRKAAVEQLSVIINQAEAEQAGTIAERLEATARAFLQTPLTWALSLPHDAAVAISVQQRQPFLLGQPHCRAARAIRSWADKFLQTPPPPRRANFFAQVCDRLAHPSGRHAPGSTAAM